MEYCLWLKDDVGTTENNTTKNQNLIFIKYKYTKCHQNAISFFIDFIIYNIT